MNREQRLEAERARKICRQLLDRPAFLAELTKRLDTLSLHPSVLITLMYYGWGKPRETVDVQQPVPVRIQHIYPEKP